MSVHTFINPRSRRQLLRAAPFLSYHTPALCSLSPPRPPLPCLVACFLVRRLLLSLAAPRLVSPSPPLPSPLLFSPLLASPHLCSRLPSLASLASYLGSERPGPPPPTDSSLTSTLPARPCDSRRAAHFFWRRAPLYCRALAFPARRLRNRTWMHTRPFGGSFSTSHKSSGSLALRRQPRYLLYST